MAERTVQLLTDYSDNTVIAVAYERNGLDKWIDRFREENNLTNEDGFYIMPMNKTLPNGDIAEYLHIRKADGDATAESEFIFAIVEQSIIK